MPPPKRPGPKQNLTAKVMFFCQTAKDFSEKLSICCKKYWVCGMQRADFGITPYYII